MNDPSWPQLEPPLVRAEEISLRLAGKDILCGISLGVCRGEIVTIIGPNGGGKTTLLRIMLGLLAPDQGQVTRTPGLKIGYMPQRLTFDPVLPLNVRRFLTLATPQSEAELRRVLEEVGAAALLNSSAHNLSGGELQRVLMARALLRDPDLLVLDEPAQGVDVHGQVELFSLISRISHQRGCAVVMVSHDLHLVMAATDRVICLNRHICCTGTPGSVRANPAFIELFSPQALGNLAIYSHQHDHHHDPVSGKECQHG
ncbi:MAG: ATP-binding cassette domain-containing protein [Desulfobulbaceae bacterium]|nr:ATP-binding cassette domain-containing protein [Desulfobulbaceae bacterium]